MSGPADHLLELMYEWIEAAGDCSSNLMDLAEELESLRENCNAVETVSNTAAVAGTVLSLIAAPFTGGASLAVGAVAGSLGAGVSAVTKLIENFESSSKLERVKEIDRKCNSITSDMEHYYYTLRHECPSSKLEDERDKYVMKEFLKAMLRRSKLDIGLEEADLDRFVREVMRDALNTFTHSPFSALLLEVIGVLSAFSLKFGGSLLLTVAAAGGLQIGKTVLVTGASAAFLGLAALGYTLFESINNWKELIKNKHETKASQSVRDTAKKIDKAKSSLSDKLSRIEKLLREAVKTHRSKPRPHPETRPNTGRRLCLVTFVIICAASLCNSSMMTWKATESHQRPAAMAPAPPDPPRNDQGSKDSSLESSELESNEDEEGGGVKMALINAHSANKCIKNTQHSSTTLIELIQNNRLDVLLITETWFPLKSLVDSSVGSILPPNYSFLNEPRFFHDREGDFRGGGVAIVYSHELVVRRVHFTLFLDLSFEYSAATMSRQGSSESVLVLTIYRPPKNKKFMDDLRYLFSMVFAQYENVIIAGDFNVWVNDLSKKETRDFLKLLEEFGLIQHVTDPTRDSNILDLVISSHDVPITDLSVQPNNFSDHDTVFFSTNFLRSTQQSSQKTSLKREKEEEREEENVKRFKHLR